MVSQQAPILVTGASGFVGRALCARLRAEGLPLRALSRHPSRQPSRQAFPASDFIQSPALAADSDWRALLAGCLSVVHCAARVHVMADTATDALTTDTLATYRAVNTAGTLALARQAAAAGVKRFILLSTIKVHGEATAPGSAFSASSPLDPQDPYAQSKAEAELGLRELAADSAMEIVILRPPLVYGPGVKANFARLLRAVERGWPLPLGRLTENRRSLLAVDNLVDLIRRCLDHPAAAGQAFVACDGEDLSTAALLQRLARANGRSLRLLPVPVALLQALARLSDRSGERSASFARLSDNLQVDMRATCALLGWQPPLDVDHALRACFANNHR